MADEPNPHHPSVYSFGETDLAARRLELVSRIFDPASEAFVAEALAATRPRLALDLGCGPGFTTRMLSRIGSPRRVIGMDRSESFLEWARAAAGGAEEYVGGDVLELPLRFGGGGERPDLIYARLLASHLDRPEQAISGWVGELAAGGFLLVEEVEGISTEVDVFERYLKVVAGMLSHHGNELYVGPRLAEARWEGDVAVEINRTVEVTPRVGNAARMFCMNLANWRHDPYIEATYSRREIGLLATELEELLDRLDRGSIVWRIRQLALCRRPA